MVGSRIVVRLGGTRICRLARTVFASIVVYKAGYTCAARIVGILGEALRGHDHRVVTRAGTHRRAGVDGGRLGGSGVEGGCGDRAGCGDCGDSRGRGRDNGRGCRGGADGHGMHSGHVRGGRRLRDGAVWNVEARTGRRVLSHIQARSEVRGHRGRGCGAGIADLSDCPFV